MFGCDCFYHLVCFMFVPQTIFGVRSVFLVLFIIVTHFLRIFLDE